MADPHAIRLHPKLLFKFLRSQPILSTYPFQDVQNNITKSVRAGSNRIGLEGVSRRVLGLRGRYLRR